MTGKYLSLITSQHQKPRYVETVRTSLDPFIDCMQFINTINERFEIDTSSGPPLQIIADWVGAPNSIPNSIVVPFFGFRDQPGTLPFSEQTHDFQGGFWRESGVSGFRAMAMSKELFRKVVKAKIKLNHSDCSIDSAKEIIGMVLDKKFKIHDKQDMTVVFEFLEDYELFERELVNLMFPLPSGVKLKFWGEDDY